MGPVTEASLFFGSPGAPPPPVDPRVWAEEAGLLIKLRLAGLAIATANGHSIGLPQNVLEPLRAAERREAATTLRLEAAMPSLVEMLSNDGIPVLVTKGPAVARAYPSRGQRPFRDVDLLVQPERLTRTLEVLRDAGFEEPPALMQPRAYFGHLCREAVNLQDDHLIAVDLHHHIPPWVWGQRLSFETLVEARRTIPLDRGAVDVPGQAHSLLIGAMHIVSDLGRPGYELLVWRDLAVLAAEADEDQIVWEARRLELEWLLALTLDHLPAYARPAELYQRLEGALPSKRDAFRLRRIVPPARLARHPIARAFRLPGKNAIAYIGGYAVPSRAFLRARYGSGGSLFRWWADTIRRLREASS